MAWEPFDPITLRMVERILVVAGGILAIYLGYRLFHIATLVSRSEGKFRSAVVEFTLSRIGPGVFFALFGAYILFASLDKPITTTVAKPTYASRISVLRTDVRPDDITGVAPASNPDSPQAQLLKLLGQLPEEDRNRALRLLDILSKTDFTGSIRREDR